MNRALVVHFSQGGSNARVARAIGAGLAAHGLEVTHHNLADGAPPDPTGYDLLGVGSPAYYFRLPLNVEAWLATLPRIDRMPAFAFIVHGAYPGRAGNDLRRALRQHGAHELGYFRCFGASRFLGYLQQGVLLSPDHPTAEELAAATRFGEAVAERHAGATYDAAPEEPDVAAVYRLERLLAHRRLVRHGYRRWFRVSGDCDPDCDRCYRVCPVGNLTRGRDGRPVWGPDCILCLYCEMQCPRDAIRSPVSWPLFRPFMRHNTAHAVRDPGLDHVPVRHAGGVTTRLDRSGEPRH